MASMIFFVSPASEPLGLVALRRRIEAHPGHSGWRPERAQRIARGFYISHAMELRSR